MKAYIACLLLLAHGLPLDATAIELMHVVLIPTDPAIQAAIDSASAQGGGVVLVPAGRYVTGPLWLKDQVELRLDAGATVVMGPNKGDWTNNGPAKNRQYGQYLGRKFAAAKNLFWIMGGDNDPKGDRECLFAFFEGLRGTAPSHQLMTYHASPPHSSTDLFQYAPWLGFSLFIPTGPEKPNDWVAAKPQPHVYEAALREYQKSDVMPFVLGESQYEGTGIIDNDMGTP